MDILAGLAAAKQAVDIARTIRDLDNALDQVALKSQIIDLMDKLNDVRSALQDAQDTLRERTAAIEQLKNDLAIREKLVERNGFKYRESKEVAGEPAGFPFCIRCDHVDHRLIPNVTRLMGAGTVCPQCKTEYKTGFRIPERSEQR